MLKRHIHLEQQERFMLTLCFCAFLTFLATVRRFSGFSLAWSADSSAY